MSAINGKTKNLGLSLINFDFPQWHTYDWNNLKAIDAVMGLALPTVKGPWEVNTAYVIGDRVVDLDQSTVWQCLVSHTSASSGTFADERTAHPTYWKAFSSVPNNRGVWSNAAILYNPGDVVNVGYAYYVCNAQHFSNDTTNTTANTQLWALVWDATAAVNAAATFDPNNFYTKTAADARYAHLAGANAFDTRPTFNTQTPWDSGNYTPQSVAQCRLNYVSSTQIRLDAVYGNQITIAGQRRTIPDAGITASNAGLTDNTIYYWYAYWDSVNSVIKLEASTTAFVYSGGLPVKSGDATRTLVGKTLVSGGGFVFGPTARYVLSFWNRRPYKLSYQQSTVVASVSASSILQLYLFAWADQAQFEVETLGWLNSAVAMTGNIQHSINAGAAVGQTSSAYTQDTSGGARGIGTHTVFDVPFEGAALGTYLMTLYAWGSSTASNCTYSVTTTATIWG